MLDLRHTAASQFRVGGNGEVHIAGDMTIGDTSTDTVTITSHLQTPYVTGWGLGTGEVAMTVFVQVASL